MTFRRPSPASSIHRAALTALLIASAAHAGGADDQAYRAATGLLNRGMYDLAAKEYTGFLASNADHPQATSARYGLAVCLVRLDRLPEASGLLEQVIAASDFEFLPDALYLHAQCRIAANDAAASLKSLHRLSTEFSTHALAPSAAALEGETLARLGRYEDAARILDELRDTSLEPAARDRTDLFLALSLAAMGKDDRAGAVAAGLRRRSPDSDLTPQATLLEAQCRHRLQQSDEAIRLYRETAGLTQAELAGPALLGLAQLSRRANQLPQAAKAAHDLLDRFPESPWATPARMELVRTALEQQRPQEALDALAPLLRDEASSTFAAASYWAAKAEMMLQRPDLAARRLARALKSESPRDLRADMQYDLAAALAQSDQLPAAAEAFQDLIRANPDHPLVPEARLGLATVLHNAGDWPRSEQEARAFLRSSPHHPRAAVAALLIAESEYRLERYEDAARAYEQFIADYPDDRQLSRAHVRRGLALAQLSRREGAVNTKLTSEAQQLLETGLRSDDLDDSLRADAHITLGDLAFAREDWPAAEREFRSAAQPPDDRHATAPADVRLKLAMAIQRQHRAAEALSLLDDLARAADDNLRSGKNANTATDDNTANSKAVNDNTAAVLSRARFEHGQILVELGRLDEAKLDFDAVLNDPHPETQRLAPHALRHLASIAAARGEPDDAAALLARLAASPGASAEALQQQGAMLITAGRYADAEAALNAMLDRFPADPVAPVAKAQLAIAVARQGRHEEALRRLRVSSDDANTLDPSLRAAVGYELARTLAAAGHASEAAEAYRKLLDADPDEPVGLYAALELADLEAAAGRYEEALAALDRVKPAPVDSGPQTSHLHARVLFLRGIAELKLSRYDRAAAALTSLLQQEPPAELIDSASLLAGEALLRAGRYADAISYLTPVAEHADDKATLAPALLLLGETCVASQRWRAADAAFSRYLEHFPAGEGWFQARFGQGWAREQQGRHAEAMQSYAQVVDHHQGPTAARSQFQIGECLYALKRHDDAVRELLKVDILYAYPQWSAAALFEAGRCLEESGKPAEARRQFQQVVDRFAQSDWARPARERLAQSPSAPAPLPGRSASPVNGSAPTAGAAPGSGRGPATTGVTPAPER